MNYTEEDVERVARAIYAHDQAFMSRFGQPSRKPFEDVSGAWMSVARAVLSSIPRRVPEGWVMVPKNPTPEMERAGDGRLLKGAFAVWATMLASAPPHPKEEPQC